MLVVFLKQAFLSGAVLFLHLLWCVWVLLGWTVTRRRPVLRTVHIASLLYAIVVESVPWIPCPLTVAETWLETPFDRSRHPTLRQRLVAWRPRGDAVHTRWSRQKHRGDKGAACWLHGPPEGILEKLGFQSKRREMGMGMDSTVFFLDASTRKGLR